MSVFRSAYDLLSCRFAMRAVDVLDRGLQRSNIVMQAIGNFYDIGERLSIHAEALNQSQQDVHDLQQQVNLLRRSIEILRQAKDE